MQELSGFRGLWEVACWSAGGRPNSINGGKAVIVPTPAKVVRIALQDAASIAGLLITTEAMVTDRPEPRPAAMAQDHDHGMGGF